MHLVYAIDHLGSGGAQRQAASLACFIRRETDVKVTILVYHEADFHAERLRSVGVDIVRIPKRSSIDPRLPGRVRAWLRGHPADVVHAFLPMPAFWFQLGVRGLPDGARPVFVAGERSAFDGHSRWMNAVRGLVYRRADAVTVNAQPMVEQVRDRLGVAEDRIHYMPNGIDLVAWDAEAAAPSPIEIEPGLFQLALIGGLRSEKNHLLTLDALDRLGRERIRDWRVWFVGAESGEPGHAERVRAEIERRGLGGTVRIQPAVQGIAAFIRRLDVLVLPSAYEGFPNVALEAMASGVPVIGSRVGDVPNLIEHGRDGLLLDSIEASSLAEALTRFHSLSGDEREIMGRRARASVEQRFSLEKVAHRHLDLYRRLLRERDPSR